MTRFSIIATDYEPYVPRDRMVEGLTSLANQSFKDYELLIVHDGPRNCRLSDEVDLSMFGNNQPTIMDTDKFYGVYGTDEFYAGYGWGHHSRDIGMKLSQGEYIINFNIDNILYPDALEKIDKKLTETGAELLVFACKHEKFGIEYFSGIPPVMGKVDMLQCVASRKAWDSIGGWYRYDHSADGFLFQEMVERYGYVHIPDVLGENR